MVKSNLLLFNYKLSQPKRLGFLVFVMVFSLGIQYLNAQKESVVISIGTDENAPIISKHIE